MEKKETSRWESFKKWFGIGALIFGTYCGANMAAGVYATQYIVPLGGAWSWVWLAMFLVFMSFSCVVGLDFIRTFKVTNYNAYFLEMYGVNRDDANPVLKRIVSIFFDIYTIMVGVLTVAATIALFAELLNSFFNVPVALASLIGVLLFAVLTINGAGFLRKFNGVMTASLLIALIVILIAVINDRGDVLAERLGSFEIGSDWGSDPKTHFWMFLSYCMITAQWGSTLSNYADRIDSKKDAVGAGITTGIMSTLLFLLTGLITLPYMPEIAKDNAPILTICQKYLPKSLTIIYWIIIIFSVVSTAPSFTYNFSNRWAAVWKTDKLSHRMKYLILSLAFLFFCWFVSKVGLVAIVSKGYVFLGKIAFFAIVIPLIISIPRTRKANKAKEGAQPEGGHEGDQ